ncbi:MAG: type III pantothenate kinase [Schleiferiaceae bacterium]|nr:type III pantothenate kinase [Schleiferiaceae bacterium]
MKDLTTFAAMLITIDIGNTRIKMGLFDGANLIEHNVIDSQEVDQALKVYAQWNHSNVRSIGIASGAVATDWPETIQWITIDSPWPFKISYVTPETLGLDRLLFSAAQWLEHRQDFITVVAGTCITYNIVKNEAFIGGAISPGWAMRYKAMHAFTAALPDLSKSSVTPVVGASTEESMRSGVDVALPLEIDAMIRAIQVETGINRVFICGGDAKALSNHLKSYIFAPSNYELYALQRIDEYFQSQSVK